VQRDSFLAGFPSPRPGPWPSSHWPPDDLETLVVRYYKPVYRFMERVLRVPRAELRDVTQEFFAEFVRRDLPSKLKYRKSFTGFMKTACRRFYINWWEARRARAPRGDKKVHGTSDGEGKAIDIPMPEADFDALFVTEQRNEVIREAHRRTEAELARRQKPAHIEVFRGRYRLDGHPEESYDALSARLGVSESKVRNTCTAVRTLFREALVSVAAERSPDAANELRLLGLLDFVRPAGKHPRLPKTGAG
jgi:RNA polymerase sigma factor (sigma-70 family)